MTYWQGLLLGVVQGLTEFLPVSSSGHLVVAEAAVGLTTPGVVVEVALHVATLLAVVIVYRTRLWQLTRDALFGSSSAWRYIGLLLLGSIPAALIGFFLADFFERAFESLLLVGVDFVVTGLILWSTRWIRPSASRQEPSRSGAFGIGVAQALAILPGISRSGATVAAGLWQRVDAVRAAEFSFLLAIPAIIGAAVLQVPHLAAGTESVGLGPLALSFAAALASGVWAIRFLVALLRKGAFHRFAPYCWAIGAVTVTWALLG
ncbi:MAG: undecaprenyl-diphosphate phosphatase [Gemmatimonadales bacterium]